VASACCAECFDSKNLSLFHFGVVVVLDEWNGFATVDAISINVVSTEASHCLNRDRFTIDLNLVAFHRFLDGSADIANTNVNSSILGLSVITLALRKKVDLPEYQYSLHP
jgi:hypothetical protein